MTFADIEKFVAKAASVDGHVEKIVVSSNIYLRLCNDVTKADPYVGIPHGKYVIKFHTQSGELTIQSSIEEEIASLENSLKRAEERKQILEKELEELKKQL